jgi:RES domain
MSCDIEGASPDGPLHRVARAPDAWEWADWAFAGPDGTFGNRWDDPLGEYRVLYASAERWGGLVETLSRFRPDPVLARALEEIEDAEGGEEFESGTVPREWLAGRVIGTAGASGEFAAIGRARSLAHLRDALADLAREHGIAELDAAAIRLRAPRAFTQAVSRHVFGCQGEDGGMQFAGVHYLSRLGDEIRNWAIFEPAGGGEPPIAGARSGPLAEDDADLAAALAHLGLRLS